MKRYVNIEIYELSYSTREEASKHRVNPTAQNETVRILSAEEERNIDEHISRLEILNQNYLDKISQLEAFDKKEFAWKWWCKCNREHKYFITEKTAREMFEDLWKEQS